MRTLTLAYKVLDGTEDMEDVDQHNVYQVEKTDFILIGILGIKDVLRENVKDSVRKC